jgi:hypothetical protein
LLFDPRAQSVPNVIQDLESNLYVGRMRRSLLENCQELMFLFRVEMVSLMKNVKEIVMNAETSQIPKISIVELELVWESVSFDVSEIA